jgi:hypothetical protein
MEPVVSEVGAGQDARRVVRVGSWELAALTGTGEQDLRICELELGRRLRYARPENVVQTIDRLVSAGKFNESEFLHTPWETRAGLGRPRKSTNGGMRWLTEEQALLVTTQSDTAVAWEITREMARVFTLARQGLLPGQRSGLSEEDVRRLVRQEVEQAVAGALGQVVAAMVKRFESLERAIAERPDGIISTHQALELKRQIALVARDLVDLGDHETLKAAKAALHQQIMAASGWGGTGRSRWTMPASRYAEALAALRALQQQSERRLRRAKRPKAQPKRGQLHLGLN